MGTDFGNMDGYGKIYLRETDFAKQIAVQSSGTLVVNCSYHGLKNNLFNRGSRRDF